MCVYDARVCMYNKSFEKIFKQKTILKKLLSSLVIFFFWVIKLPYLIKILFNLTDKIVQ